MRISAVIPVYNRPEMVLQAIECVLKQTVAVDEIIVVDDGSTDGTAEVVKQHYGRRVRLLQQSNAGVAAARNLGIREALGEWIAFLDSDDVWLPNKIERQLAALSSQGNDVGCCFTDNFFEKSPDLKVSKFQESGFRPSSPSGVLADPAQFILEFREPFFTSSMMIKRALLMEIGGFDELLIIGEDTDLFFQLSFLTKFCFVAEPLTGVDRDPSRALGLCNLYFTRDDKKYETLQRRFFKWLVMPEVAGTGYELPVRRELQMLCYDSAECKIHQWRFLAAIKEVKKLKALGETYAGITRNLIFRKIQKLSQVKVSY